MIHGMGQGFPSVGYGYPPQFVSPIFPQAQYEHSAYLNHVHLLNMRAPGAQYGCPPQYAALEGGSAAAPPDVEASAALTPLTAAAPATATATSPSPTAPPSTTAPPSAPAKKPATVKAAARAGSKSSATPQSAGPRSGHPTAPPRKGKAMAASKNSPSPVSKNASSSGIPRGDPEQRGHEAEKTSKNLRDPDSYACKSSYRDVEYLVTRYITALPSSGKLTVPAKKTCVHGLTLVVRIHRVNEERFRHREEPPVIVENTVVVLFNIPTSATRLQEYMRPQVRQLQLLVGSAVPPTAAGRNVESSEHTLTVTHPAVLRPFTYTLHAANNIPLYPPDTMLVDNYETRVETPYKGSPQTEPFRMAHFRADLYLDAAQASTGLELDSARKYEGARQETPETWFSESPAATFRSMVNEFEEMDLSNVVYPWLTRDVQKPRARNNSGRHDW